MSVTTNAHTHLELCDLAHLCPPSSQPFYLWLRRLVWSLAWRNAKTTIASVEHGIAELRAAGTTHVGDVTATWQSVDPLLSSGLGGVVYLEVAGLRRRRALARLDQARERILRIRSQASQSPMQVGLSLHAPYSCHPDLLREGASWCRQEKVPLCIHVAESPAEVELLEQRTLSSVPWPDRVLAYGAKLGRIASSGQRPLAYLATLGVLDARPLLVHAVHVTEEEIRQIADAGCTVAHCPRSNQRLDCGRMPLERFLAAGVRVYLGTDSLASSPSLSIQHEAAFARKAHAGCVSSEQIDSLLHQRL